MHLDRPSIVKRERKSRIDIRAYFKLATWRQISHSGGQPKILKESKLDDQLMQTIRN